MKIDQYQVNRIQMASKTEGVCFFLLTYKYEEEKKEPIKVKKKKGAKADEQMAAAEEKVARDDHFTLI